MKISKADKVSHLGMPGSNSFQAAKTLFPDAELLSCGSFQEVIESVSAGDADVAVVPIENSIAGRVVDAHGLMLSLDLQIAQEYLLPIEHCLVGRHAGPRLAAPDELGRIRRVVSHPQALSQCKRFIAERLPNAKVVPAADTASAVREVAENGGDEDAAIGSRSAAEVYGGRVLAVDIADVEHNVTRFLAFTSPDNLEDDGRNEITTLIFQVRHTPGALLSALSAFSAFGVNLMKLETYMISDEIKHPTFYVDVGAGLQDERMKKALETLKEHAIYIKLLGTYQASPDRSAPIGFLPVA